MTAGSDNPTHGVHISNLTPGSGNPTRGVCALSSDADSSLLALPSSTSAGTVVVHDCINLHVVCEVPAHNSPLAAVSLTPNGSLLATVRPLCTAVEFS
jgi:hypothetical protein